METALYLHLVRIIPHSVKPKFRFGTALILLFSLLGASCTKKDKGPSIAPPVKVSVLEISLSNNENGREYSGTVSSSESTTVSFSVAGTITELYAKEGQKVTKGQLLGKVRNGEYLNAYNIAQAQLAEAQDGYNRLKKLHDANALPDIKWVEIQQKLKQAENAAEMAKRTLDDANLHAPTSGTITQKYADVGQTVIPVQPVYEIVALNDLTIDIPVSENEIRNFETGEKAKVYLESLGKDSIEGKVTQKSITADPLTRSYTVKVSIPNSDNKILPGMIGTVSFPALHFSQGTPEEGYILPSQAVQLNDDNRWFVWVVNDSVAERRFVTADELAAKGVIINSGLKPGDKVIVEGMEKVGTGSRVRY